MSENELSLFTYDVEDDFSDMSAEDLILPRLNLMQGMSPDVTEGKALPATITRSDTGEVIVARDSVRDVLFLTWWKEWVEWNPDRSAKNKILRRSTDPMSELALIEKRREKVMDSKGKEAMRVTLGYNVMMLCPDEDPQSWDQLYIMNFMKTAYKVFKRTLNIAKQLRGEIDGQKIRVPLFGASYPLSVTKESDGENTWFIPKIGQPTVLGKEYIEALIPKVQELKMNIEAMKAANSAATEHSESDAADDAQDVDTSAMDV